jgi:hypothetical protein
MTDEQMRTVMLDYFKRDDVHFCLAPGMQEALGTIASIMGFLPKPSQTGFTHNVRYGSPVVPLVGDDWTQAVDVLWQMIGEGLLRPGNYSGYDAIPYFYPTRYGWQVIKGTITPYDPDGYFSRLKEKAPDVDELVLIYLREALHTFRTGCTLSSAVCLGCASEAAFDVMLEAYAETLSVADEAAFRKKTDDKPIKARYDEFMKEYEAKVKPNIDRELRSSLGTLLGGLFQVIRNQRNDAGHPTGETIEREQLYATIVAVPSQFDKMYQLIRQFKANKRK